MDRGSHPNHHENGDSIDLDQESEIISEEILAKLVNDDENSWLSIDLLQPTNGVNNSHHHHHLNGYSGESNDNHSRTNDHHSSENGADGGDLNLSPYDNVSDEQMINGKDDCDLKEWLTNVLENEAYKSTKDNLVRELDNLAVLHKLESSARSNKFGRMIMPERNLETRRESRLEYNNKEAKLDTRTITKRKPTFFNRFLSSEELSPSNGNLRSTKLNYSSSKIGGSNSNLNNNHLSGSNNELESSFTMRKSKLNSTFTMDEDEGVDHHNESFTITRRDQNIQRPHLQGPTNYNPHLQGPTNYNHQYNNMQQKMDQHYSSNTATITRGVNGIASRKTDDQSVKKKPISMYSVYAEPTDSRPMRSSNTSVLSAYRLFKSSALNRQYEYRDDKLTKIVPRGSYRKK